MLTKSIPKIIADNLKHSYKKISVCGFCHFFIQLYENKLKLLRSQSILVSKIVFFNKLDRFIENAEKWNESTYNLFIQIMSSKNISNTNFFLNYLKLFPSTRNSKQKNIERSNSKFEFLARLSINNEIQKFNSEKASQRSSSLPKISSVDLRRLKRNYVENNIINVLNIKTMTSKESFSITNYQTTNHNFSLKKSLSQTREIYSRKNLATFLKLSKKGAN